MRDSNNLATAEVWDSITKEELRKLLDSMPSHLGAVLKSKGGETKHQQRSFCIKQANKLDVAYLILYEIMF